MTWPSTTVFRPYSPSRQPPPNTVSSDVNEVKGWVGARNQGHLASGGETDWVVQMGRVTWEPPQ